MNGSTFKLDPITVYDETTPGCVVRIEDAIDAHLENGIIEGDRFERKAAGKETGYIGEPINTILITGGKYCTVSNMTIRQTTGHTIFTRGVDGPGVKITEFSRTAIVNGNETANAKASTSPYIDLSGIMAWNEQSWKAETDPERSTAASPSTEMSSRTANISIACRYIASTSAIIMHSRILISLIRERLPSRRHPAITF